jgi:hypothetical protein
MAITTTGNLGPMILQSLAPAMLYVPTPTMNYITICDKVSMPTNGGTTCRFMRPRALQPPTIQLGNSKKSGVVKFSLIEVEARWGDTAQAKAA